MSLLPQDNAVFEDPYVEPNSEYSYTVRFVAPGWNYSSFTESASITTNAGKGELKLQNEPAGKLNETKKKFTFTEKTEFSDVGSPVDIFMVVQYQKTEWTSWGGCILDKPSVG